MEGTQTEATQIEAAEDAALERYLAVWAIADDAKRHDAVAALWSADGVEFVEGARFEGRARIADRVKEAHDAFVANGRYVVGWDNDLSVHGDMLRFTIHLAEPVAGDRPGEVAWAARVFLLLDEHGLVQQSYQLTVKPLPVS